MSSNPIAPSPITSGPIAWMTRHKVAPNLLMAVLLIGGFMMSLVIKKEFLPTTVFDLVRVSVSYPGATPAEMERGVVLPIENEISGLDGIKETSVRVSQGYARLNMELRSSANTQQVFQEIQQAVNRISTFPDGIEQPDISLRTRNVDVMELVVHGGLDNISIKRLAEKMKDRLLQSTQITQVEFRGLPAEEIHIDVPQLTLQQYGLTLQDIAQQINRTAVERSAGSVKTEGGEILVTVDDRRYWASEFARLPIISDQTGDQLLLGDIAQVREGFEDTNRVITFDGEPGVSLRVYRVEDQTPDAIAEAVYGMWDDLETMLPPGTRITVIDDDAKTYTQRLDLLLKNAFIGLALVMVLLGIFLEYRLAFWVVMGIPTSFLGAVLFLPLFDVSINVISMFGFIIALGIVVDDAIIAGENIYEQMQKGIPFEQAAVEGARQIALPLTFAILTNIVAFLPLLFVPGIVGMMFGVTPIVVIACFLISWIEALFILPTHLAHINEKPSSKWGQKLDDLQERCDHHLHRFINTPYKRALSFCLDRPGITISTCVAILLIVFAHAFSGRMGFSVFPPLEGEWAVAKAELPLDAPYSQALVVRQQMETAAREMATIYDKSDPSNHETSNELVVNVKSEIEGSTVEVALLLTPSEIRPISAHETVQRWREVLGQLANVKSLTFDAERGGGPHGGAGLTLELRHSDTRVLEQASKEIERHLQATAGVADVANDLTNGKSQWELKLNEHGRALNLNADDVARQVRHSLYGARAIRQQRLRNEVTVLVRLPETERRFAGDIERLLITTPDGSFVPLMEIADITKTRAPARINRRDGQRIVRVTADVQPRRQTPAVMADVSANLIPQLEIQYPGLHINYRGRQADAAESASALQIGMLMTLLIIYALLAIPFRSYVQPLLIISVIPFGAVGAILGHILLGYGLSVISLQGIVALMGVVVNDSLILVDYANKQRLAGIAPRQAALNAATRRFRPILLTTITTFGGLAPMVFETSRQAQFIVPMAVSLGFGILFTTFICLLMLPALYLWVEEMREKRNTAHQHRSAESATTPNN